MYQFHPATPRILRLRDTIRNHVIRNDAGRSRLITEAYRKYDGIMPQIKRPLAAKYVYENMDLFFGEDELIAGCKGGSMFAACQYLEYMDSDWILKEVDSGAWKLEDDGFYRSGPNEELKQEH